MHLLFGQCLPLDNLILGVVAYLNDLNKRLLCKSEIIKEYMQLENKRAVLSKEIERCNIQIHKLHTSIADLNQRRSQIEFDLGITN